MKRLLILSFALFISINTFSKTEVRGLVLKFMLIDLCYEMYETNVIAKESHSEGYYNKRKCAEHYNWLRNTYNSLGKSQKEDLSYIMTSIHPQQLMQQTAILHDTSDFNTVLKQIINSKSGFKFKRICKRFFTAIYINYIKDYLACNVDNYKQRATMLNAQLEKDTFDIINFMEMNSGIKFPVKKNPIFYYTMRPIGAVGLTTKTDKISTIQSTVNTREQLFGTPFHEFSHELFKTFTLSEDFKILTKQLQTDSLLISKLKGGIKFSYKWRGWCEENLVEGYSKYLFSLFTQQTIKAKTYVYDYEFYLYLKRLNFDSSIISLKQVSFDFLNEIINSNNKNSR